MGTLDEEYEEQLWLDFPLTRHLSFALFTVSDEVVEEHVKKMYIDQNAWDVKCFTVPVSGIEGDVDHIITPEGQQCGVGFHSWLLGVEADKGGYLFRGVERGSDNRYFLTTMFKQRHKARRWIDKDANREIEEDLNEADC